MEDLMVFEKIVSDTRRWFALVDTYERILRDTEEKLAELEAIIVELKEMFGSNKNVDKSIPARMPARPTPVPTEGGAGGDSYRGGVYAERRD
jgi:hypothetical protein